MGYKSRLSFLVCLCFLATTAAAGQVELQGKGKGKPNKPVKKIIRLQPTTSEPNAHGIAKIFSKNKGKPNQRFQVVGVGLMAGISYDLFVNGEKVATEAASAEPGEEGGAVEFLFSDRVTSPTSEGQQPLPASLNPVTKIMKVELKNSSGQVVLEGEFPTNS